MPNPEWNPYRRVGTSERGSAHPLTNTPQLNDSLGFGVPKIVSTEYTEGTLGTQRGTNEAVF